MVVTAVAMIATGGTASPFAAVLVGEFFGAIGGAAGAAMTGGNIGSGMLIGAIIGGVTGGMMGPAGTSSQLIKETVVPMGIKDLATTTFTFIPGSSATQIATTLATQSIASSAVGAGGSVLSTMMSAAMNTGVNAADKLSTAISSQTATDVNSWGPKWAERIVPRYGKYGGPGYGDPTYRTEPFDQMDEFFRQHDKNWAQGLGDKADKKLAEQLNVLNPNPRKWDPPSDNILWSKIYRKGAQEYFRRKSTYLEFRGR